MKCRAKDIECVFSAMEASELTQKMLLNLSGSIIAAETVGMWFVMMFTQGEAV